MHVLDSTLNRFLLLENNDVYISKQNRTFLEILECRLQTCTPKFQKWFSEFSVLTLCSRRHSPIIKVATSPDSRARFYLFIYLNYI